MRGTSRIQKAYGNFVPVILLRTVLLILYLIAPIPGADAQEEHSRPSVGLVLSGGGAHGIAHLGVIRVMEEAGLRPDYITGVSMGSIIGGLYSLGYPADSLYRILKKTDWNDIFTNRIPENKIIFLEKSNFYNSIVSLPTSSRKVTLPSGMINGQLIESMLNYYAWPAADINDFNRLPIPFMCVGSDILTFRIADLKSGYLPDAIRASFAVPSIFTPMKIDTMLLVDGGLLRNFAASEARDMGADILIGSYSGFQAYSEDELQSVSGIIKQIAFYRSLEDFNEQKKLVRYLVIHKLKNLPKTGFENVDSLFTRGYIAALPFREKFRQLADSLDEIEKQKPMKNILGKKTYSFDKIEIEGNNIYSSGQIRGILEIEPGQQVDKDMLNDRIELLYGKAWFEKVKYRIEPRNDSLILVLHCEEKPRGMFYGSVHYDNYLKAGINLGFSVKNLLTNNSIININTCVAQFFRIDVNAIQFINYNQKFGFTATFNADNTMVPMYEINGEKGDIISRNFIPGVSVNRYVGLNQLTNLSVRYDFMNLVPQYNSDHKIRNIAYSYLTAGWNYHVNTLDSKYFPEKGVLLDLTASTSKLISRSIRSDSSNTLTRITGDGNGFERFYTLYGHLRYNFSVSGKMTFSVGGDALYITGTDSVSSGNNSWFLGGVEPVNRRSIPLIGFHANELATDKMASVGVAGDLEFLRDIHFQFVANAAAVRIRNTAGNTRILAGYGIGLGYMSLIGPIRIGIMHGSSNPEDYFNKLKGYISIGYRF